jgi:hypothetical protein
VSYLDPLTASRELLEVITGDQIQNPPLALLAQRLDAFVYSLRFLLIDGIAAVPADDAASSPPDYDGRYAALRQRFPNLGLYWIALSTSMDSNHNGEIATGDAIDDLTDIADDLSTVARCETACPKATTLSALRFCYESHIWTHIYTLRTHLEERLRK